MEDQEVFMTEAIRLATESAQSGGGPFGAVVVRDREVVSTGQNNVTRDHDPTAHAEVQAIRAAGEVLGTHDLTGCVLFASCEPCPMCLAACYWARLDAVYFSATRADAAAAGFDDAWLYEEVAKKMPARTLKMAVLGIENATAPFEAWRKNSDRVAY